MKLPHADESLVERTKIVDYLLNSAHRYGVSKARFFASYGFRVEEWERLAESLREHGCTNDVARVRETGYGPHFVIDGELNAPDGRRPRVRSVWQLNKGTVGVRLITAYPLESL